MTSVHTSLTEDLDGQVVPAGAFHPWRVLRTLIKGNADTLVDLYLLTILYCKGREWHGLGQWLCRRLHRRHMVALHYEASYPHDLFLRHPMGVVIGRGVKIGRRVRIYQNVTLGGARIGDGLDTTNYPKIGDNTVIFAGACIIGDVSVGNDCTIGANAVVTRDVPDGCIAVGIPARCIPKKTPVMPVNGDGIGENDE